MLSRLTSPRVTKFQAAEGQILAQSILNVVNKLEAKAIRRIDNLLFLVSECPTEFKGSQAVARTVNVPARRNRVPVRNAGQARPRAFAQAAALMKPDESFVAIDTEIRRVADEIASAFAGNQNQPDCDPPEVAEWVDRPTDGPLADAPGAEP